MRKIAFALSLIGLMAWVPVGRAQSATPVSSGTTVASASVLLTFFMHNEPDGTSMLDLAVLWRGSPGWFTAGSPGGRSGGGSSTALPDGRSGPEMHFIAVDALRLEARFDPVTRRAQIQDQVIPLENVNLILVDDVDGAGGPGVADMWWIGPRFQEPVVGIETLVRRSPELLPFLRCDDRFPDQPQHPPIEVEIRQQMTELTCARLQGR
jgi:hypothetical protein